MDGKIIFVDLAFEPERTALYPARGHQAVFYLSFRCRILSYLFMIVHAKFEAISQFFVGYFDANEKYVDSLLAVALKNFSSLSGFWFDLLTSVPWSYFDMTAYQVITSLIHRARRRMCALMPSLRDGISTPSVSVPPPALRWNSVVWALVRQCELAL